MGSPLPPSGGQNQVIRLDVSHLTTLKDKYFTFKFGSLRIGLL